jgi:hypothetical protein
VIGIKISEYLLADKKLLFSIGIVPRGYLASIQEYLIIGKIRKLRGR